MNLPAATYTGGITSARLRLVSVELAVAVLLLARPETAAQTALASGLFYVTREAGEVELVAYAERAGAGLLRMQRGTIEDLPVIHELVGLRASVPSWRPTAVDVTTLDAFRAERYNRSEWRSLAMAFKPLSVFASLVRVVDLERRDSIVGLLRSVRASSENPGFALVAMTMTSGANVRYYPIRLTPIDK